MVGGKEEEFFGQAFYTFYIMKESNLISKPTITILLGTARDCASPQRNRARRASGFMAALIHKVFEAITDLEPLSPSATPRTQKHFKETTDSFQQYSNLIHCHLVGIREASGIKPEFDWDEPEEPEESEGSEAEGPGKAKTKSKIVISFLFFFLSFFTLVDRLLLRVMSR